MLIASNRDYSPMALTAARGLLVFATLALFFSPPLVNLAQLLLVLLVVSVGDLRGRLVRSWQQPMVKAGILYWLFLGAGVMYSVGTWQESLNMWFGWRKLLLLPLAMALFDDVRWKERFTLSFLGLATLCALVSFVLAWLGLAVDDHHTIPGIFLRNHATQGMVFALAACSLLLVANIATVTFGRSGYVVLLVGFAALLLSRLMVFRGGRRRDTVVALLAAGLVVAALAASPTVAQRMTQAVHEMRDYRQAEEVTSMGIRMAFWKNTATLIQERPVLGFGTGAFAPAYARLVAGKTGVLNSTTGDPHNQFLKTAAENGLVGLGLFLVFLGAAFRQPSSQPYRLLGLGALVAWCGTSLFSSHFSTFNEGTLIYLWVGILLARDTAFDSRRSGP